LFDERIEGLAHRAAGHLDLLLVDFL
jgi:hypothetical protein